MERKKKSVGVRNRHADTQRQTQTDRHKGRSRE